MKRQDFSWGIGGFLIAYQLLLLLSLPFYFHHSTPSGGLIVCSIALLYTAGMCITAGYHRYFSHRTYKTNPIVETILLFLGAMALQSSALRWSNDHRLHHAHVDTDKDPYSIKKGFWYAHFLWMLQKPDPIDPKVVGDLQQNPRVMFQDRHIFVLMFGLNGLAWLLMGWLFNDYLGAFFVGVGLRIFALHHLTWFINSLAHTWGDKPFSQEQSAVNNYALSFLTFGEGYHNYHHVFAKDYRNGVRWYHFDPTKWLIWTLAKCGFVSDLRKMDELTIKKRMVVEHKSLLLDHLKEFLSDKKEDLETKVEEISERMIQTIAAYKSLREKFRTSDEIAKLKEELNSLQMRLKQDAKQWRLLSKTILAT